MSDGWPIHKHDSNARKRLARLIVECRLPLELDELLGHAYRLGAGDPWEGHRSVVTAMEQALDGARDPVAVLRSRLAAAGRPP